MKYLKEFDLIIENMAQARKILKDNDINKDDEKFKAITDKTNKDGYTGFITKLVFEFAMNIEGALDIYDELKKYKIDLGTPKIKEILNDKGMPNAYKIQHIVELIRKAKKGEENGDYELLFNSNGFNVYVVNDYKGIMCTGSPAWCLKTKSQWKSYTEQKRGTQFVLIDSRLVGENDEFELIVPDNWDGKSYQKPGWETTRYGVTIYPTGRMEIFNDGNTQSMVKFKDDELEVTHGSLPIFVQRVLKELHTYFIKEIQPHIPNIVEEPKTPEDFEQNDEYDNFKEVLDRVIVYDSDDELFVEGSNTSFNYTVEFDSFKTEEVYQEFIDAILRGMNIETKEQLFNFMKVYKNRIDAEPYFTEYSGIMDIFYNEFLCYDFEAERTEEEEGEIALDEYPTVTKRSHPLGGYYYDEAGIGETSMKYYYGFQHDKYGKAAILQSYDTLTDYYAAMANNFFDIITEGEILYMEIDSYFNMNQIEPDKLLSVSPHKDGFEVTINWKYLSKFKNKDYEISTWLGNGKSDKKIIGDMNDKEFKIKVLDSIETYFKHGSINEDGNIVIPICTNP